MHFQEPGGGLKSMARDGAVAELDDGVWCLMGVEVFMVVVDGVKP